MKLCTIVRVNCKLLKKSYRPIFNDIHIQKIYIKNKDFKKHL